ncbi:MAG TPA: glycosyl hydrolase family 65 protein [Mobilitalea sp.]|nr:glycosyl hydrolase family 65 protein [Mobilitalea sp.]
MITNMNYKRAKEWILEEDKFDSSFLGKCEAIMSLGNGYLGLRSTTEEKYTGEKRGYFIAGTFNKFSENEVTELPNLADIVNLELIINGQQFTLDKGVIKEYSRQLNLKTGELCRHVLWISPKGDELNLNFYRIVSLDNIHLTSQKIIISPINNAVHLKIVSGIDGSMSNSGSQHFLDGEKRFYDKKYMQLVQTTTESNVNIVHNTTLSFKINEKQFMMKSHIKMGRRKIYCEYNGELQQGNSLVIEKISNVYTSRDIENKNLDLKAIQENSLQALKESVMAGYDIIAKNSSNAWNENVWDRCPISIESDDGFDQLAIRFAQYHLCLMTPSHDSRMSIAAKGLSGEGYKGHTFWDTDIFLLPYFTFTNPEIAKKLEIYRYLTLEGAHKKAKENGYEGAQFPWESAWLDAGEVTPVWGDVDIVTGLPTKIWSGFIEQHITADVAYGIWQYYMVTGDQAFMDEYGYEIIFDTAKFWVSRLEYSDVDNKYHINDVVGPDEYKEHVNDNAFTNYMAYWNIKKALEYYKFLKNEKVEIFEKLCDKLDVLRISEAWLEVVNKIYIPMPRESDLVIPQDNEYLELEDIDLTKYKKQENVGSLFLDYNLEQVNKIQVSKQADVMILFFLLEDMFSLDVKKANWNYYEPRTLHDSSLSLSTHCILANDMGDTDLSYELFQRACCIDLGLNMKTSDDGIHTASIGGIWQSVIYGFGGIRMLNGKLRIEPKLPKTWKSLGYSICWKGQTIKVNVFKDRLYIENLTEETVIEFVAYGKAYKLLDKIEIYM